jgi:hypothetical protein
VPEKSNEKFRHGITILDPTCGSGAFLFAALNVLEPLYEDPLSGRRAPAEPGKILALIDLIEEWQRLHPWHANQDDQAS